jgi:hypothetical protein
MQGCLSYSLMLFLFLSVKVAMHFRATHLLSLMRHSWSFMPISLVPPYLLRFTIVLVYYVVCELFVYTSIIQK